MTSLCHVRVFVLFRNYHCNVTAGQRYACAFIEHRHSSFDRQTLPFRLAMPASAAMVASTITRPSPSSDPISIYLSDNSSGSAAYIFSHAEAFRCRTSHRILGDFVGTLPKHTSQNQYLSLPLALSYDEICFGISRGFFRIVSAHPRQFAEPTENTVTRFWQERKVEQERQVDEALRHQEEEREKRRKKGVKRTRAEMENAHQDQTQTPQLNDLHQPPQKAARLSFFRRAVRGIRTALHVLVPVIEPPPPLPLLPPVTTETIHTAVQTEPDEAQKASKSALQARLRQQARATTLIVTSTVARPDEMRSGPSRRTPLPRPPGVSSQRLADRAAVFADLHDKGYYLSCGAKFGADFLAYAGDPQLFHAALAVVVAAADETISPLDVVALGRLGDSTKKRTVLAFREEGQVQYIGVQWEETLP